MTTVTQDFVRELIDFAPTEETKRRGFAETQLEGTVAIYNMLQRNSCAYLADEVGMGKTYVALGVIALVRYFNPKARIVVIAPRENIQRKWTKELHNFVRSNWRIVGNRVKSLQGGPAWEPVMCNGLRDFIHEALLNADRDFFLRMTSFSLALKQLDSRRRLRRNLRTQVPWIDRRVLSAKTVEGFRHGFGCALNAAVPEADLVVVDEAHNLKHGFSEKGSIRNHIMGLAFGRPTGNDVEMRWYGQRSKRVLFLSATPFEEDYAAIQRQFDVFGFGDARLRGPSGDRALQMRALADPDVLEDDKREIVKRIMVRRVSGLNIGGQLHTKNMYRREWRRGGYSEHDEPMKIEDPIQRLVVALMQKKVAEILQDERFNNHFQIGMLSSFESFLESVSTSRHARATVTEVDEEEDGPKVFDGRQTEDDHERRGIDTDAIARVVESFRSRFNHTLPHPKLDSTAQALAGAFETGEKTLVFVRRVRTVDELAAKLNRSFDGWIRDRMLSALPDMQTAVMDLFDRYEKERARRPDEQLEALAVDRNEIDTDEAIEDPRYDEEEDQGSAESFFAWFFRGKGPDKVLSGAAFQKNRLGATSSAYATMFEDDHVAWLLGRPDDTVAALAEVSGTARDACADALRQQAYAHFRGRSRQKEGYPRLYVFEAYQISALEMLEAAGGELGDKAAIVLQERYEARAPEDGPTPDGFPGHEDSVGAVTFFTELVRQPELRQRVWPAKPDVDFRAYFRAREQRRELLSALARLGAAYVDLYLLAIRELGSLTLRQETEAERPERRLVREYVQLLCDQMEKPGFHAFYELSCAAQNFDLLLSVNFHQVPKAPLSDLAAIYGRTLQRQVPVGRMSGGVNKRLVRQFRMPGFPLVLATTDVLQEGEDLHTFCRQVVHYGITWTPSAMEQRTGRIDRIGSLVQRNLDGCDSVPSENELIQVFYPHLQDTVEVLQVQRVLKRLNRFLHLIHKRGRVNEPKDSRIDMARAILEELDYCVPVEGPLESAFPVQKEWLRGGRDRESVMKPNVMAKVAHLDELWEALQEQYEIEPQRAGDTRFREGLAALTAERLAAAGESIAGEPCQRFHLELRSQAAGDATLLRCRSPVKQVDLHDNDVVDLLYELQRDTGRVKVCCKRDARDKQDVISVEGGILFDAATTQLDEVAVLVERTVRAAYRITAGLSGSRSHATPVEFRWDSLPIDLDGRIDQLIRQRGLAWRREGAFITVDLGMSQRTQRVEIRRHDSLYVFRSVVVGTHYVTRTDKTWRDLARRVWRKNAAKDLITFAFDEQDRLLGRIEQPVVTLDHEELELYVDILAKECDRFEYVLTGEDEE